MKGSHLCLQHRFLVFANSMMNALSYLQNSTVFVFSSTIMIDIGVLHQNYALESNQVLYEG